MRFRLNREPAPLDRPGFAGLLSDANIGRRYWNAMIGGIPPEREHRQTLIDYINDYDENERRGIGLIVAGPYGTGKTTILSILLREAMRRAPCSAWFMPMPEVDWYARHRDAVGPNGVPVWNQIIRSQVVAIDDVGSERQVEWNDCWFEEVIRCRYNEQLVTHVSLNADTADLDTLFKRFQWLRSLARDAFKIVFVDGEMRQ